MLVHNCYTFDPRLIPKTTVVPFITYMYQDVTLDQIKAAIETGQDEVSEKSRDMGASWLYLIVFSWFFLFHPHTTFRLISETVDKVDKTAEPDSLFWKLDFILDKLPPFLRTKIKRNFLLLLNELNESTITGCSTTGDAARGGRCTAMLIDEAAAIPINEANKLMSSTQHVTKCRLFNSTHQGTGGPFYRITADGRTPKMILHWSLHPIKQKGLYYSVNGKLVMVDKQCRMKWRLYGTDKEIQFPDDYPFILDGKLRSPWYDYECDRASHPMEIAQELDMDPFASAAMFFDSVVVERIGKEDCRPALMEGYLEYNEETLEPIGFVEQEKGPLRLWFLPGADGRPPRSMQAAGGIDISAGTGASNSCSAWGDMLTREKVAEYVDAWIKPEEFAKLTIAMAKWFNDAYLIWDGAGAGGTFGQVIVDAGYRHFYYQRAEERLFKKDSDTPGYFLNPKPKRNLLGLYRKALKDKTFIQRSADANSECMEFIFTIRGTVEHSAEYGNLDPSGAKASHGDRVVADALLNKAYDVINVEHDEDDGTMPWNCPAAREEKALAAMSREGEEPMWDEP